MTENTDAPAPLQIVSLQAENVKRLVAVAIRPTGELVEITGRNGQGKTSVLDCIEWALKGAGAVQAKPIRRGQDKANIVLDLGEYRIKRTFTQLEGEEFSTQLVVENREGGRLQKGQTLVESFLGELTLDPLAFAHAKAKEQFDMLKGMVAGDIEALDAANRTDFAKRTDVSRQAKARRTEADAIPVPDTTPAGKVDEEALLKEIGEVGAFNAELERRAERREAVRGGAEDDRKAANFQRSEATRLRDEAAKLIAEAESAEGTAASLDLRATEADEKLKAAPPLEQPKDAAEVRRRLDAAKATNAAVDQSARRKALRDEADRLEVEAKRLTEAMEAREEAKRKAIAEAKLPVEGLGFGEGFITLNGVPFEQASDAEQLRTSAAIAMAGSPRLRVVRVREGSLLDEDGLKLLAEMAAARGFQVWIERVDSSGTRGFVIEDGHVRATPEPAKAAAE